MPRRYVTADVFTDVPFGGNPLAVVLDAEGLTDAQMQAITREFGYSESTFVLPPRDAAHTARVRIFTPTREVPFAGHPNVGTAVVLAREWVRMGRALPDQFLFEEGAGLVPVALQVRDGVVAAAELRAPERLSIGASVSVADAADCLGLAASDLRVDEHAPCVASVGLPFLIVELASREALRRARGERVVHARVLRPIGIDGVYAYVRGAKEGDWHARMFAPLDEMPEDPATGSATAAMIALRAALPGAGEGERTWRILQGEDMGRPSRLLGRTLREAGDVASVHVGGGAVVMMEGALQV
jgi:trans-2,3-dihydro-3-hydroxyanthranilate isomerase